MGILEPEGLRESNDVRKGGEDDKGMEDLM